jgi:DNA-binding NtrC family response regulator
MHSQAAPDRILVVCDDVSMQTWFASLGKRVDQMVVTSSCAEALRWLEGERFELVIVDVDLPGINDGEFFAKARTLHPTMRRMAFNGSEALKSARLPSSQGAYECLTKRTHPEGFKCATKDPLDLHSPVHTAEHLRCQAERNGDLAHVVGESAPMRHLFGLIKLVADSHCTVLIQGETGTGKELIARAIHHHSPRHAHAFVAVDCGAVSESLLESELFGHVRGAFTGAVHGRQGLFQEAHEGTLLLDEIGNTTLAFQAKLLRVLQEGEIRPVGGHKSVKVDVRVIASTNKDLRKAVEEKTFRQDLYYRLAVVPLVIPPLRQRREDIPLLIDHFLAKYCRQNRRHPKRLSSQALQLLVNARWPGNVRELEHVIERAVVLGNGEAIQPEDLTLAAPTNAAPTAGPPRCQTRLEAAEREALGQALQEHGGDKRATARDLGIALSTLYAKLKKSQAQPVFLPTAAHLPG